jgi:UDP-glucose 4-epimerase
MKRKVIVTGASGFVGTQLVKTLKVSDFEIYSLDTIESPNLQADINYVRVDLNTVSLDFLSNLFHESVVIHLAALSTTAMCESNPDLAIDVNLKITRKIVDAANIAKSPIIFASSEWVYQESPIDQEMDENQQLQLLEETNLYAMTKIVGEWIIKKYSQNYVILRFGIIYGERERPQSAIESIVQSALVSGRVEIGNAQTARRFIHVNDICEGIVRCVENLSKASNCIFNLVGNNLISLKMVVDEIEKFIGKSIILDLGESSVSIRNPSPRLFERVFAWKPEISLKVGIQRLIEWELRKKREPM